jgi:hypothetical protein
MTTATIDYGHLEPVDVHFDDLDPMGIVHNARYAPARRARDQPVLDPQASSTTPRR